MSFIIRKHISLNFANSTEITDMYRGLNVDYPKFFKMDNLSKMAFVASELLLKDTDNRFLLRDDVAIIFFNSSSSLEVDTEYQKTIQSSDDYFPSPSLFVYTLPNICAGEVAIRNKYCGETSFYILEKLDLKQIFDITNNTLTDNDLTFALVGWLENYRDTFEVKMAIVSKQK